MKKFIYSAGCMVSTFGLVTGAQAQTALLPTAAAASPDSAEPGSNAKPVDQSTVAVAPEQNSVGLVDIIVTATRRETNLQTTAVAVTAFDGEALRQAQVKGLGDLQQITPSLVVSSNAGQESPIALRGISSGIQGIGGDSPVAIYLDGVYLARPQAALFEFADIEQIDVLRGPQGTLFGRNNTGGAINITTAVPNADNSGSFGLRYGSRNEVAIRGAVNTALTDKLFVKFAGSHREDDGAQRFADTGERANGDNATTLDAGLRYQASDKLTLDLRGDYSRTKVPVFLRLFSPGAGRYGLSGCALDCDLIYADEKAAHQVIVGRGGSFTAAYDLDAVKLKAITGYRTLRVDQLGDNDQTDVRLLRFAQVTKSRQFSQEFNVSSGTGGRLNWVGGLYYFHENASANYAIQQFQTDTRSLIIGGLAIVKSESYAAYANASYDVTDQLTVSAGIRYSHETKDFDRTGGVIVTNIVSSGSIAPRPIATPQYTGVSRKFEYANPRFDIQYKVNENSFIYANYSTGSKSGGFSFSAQGTADPSFGPEKIKAFEVGLKNTLFDRQVRINLSAYHYDYSGLQVSLTPSPGVRSIYNAAEARIKGIDAEFEFAPHAIPGLKLSGNAALLDAKYRNFLVDFANLGAVGAAGQCFGGQLSSALVCNFSGNRLPRAPKLQLTFIADYKIDAGNAGTFQPHLQLSHFSNYFYTPNNDYPFGASRPYTLLDGQIGWTPKGSRWKFSLWGRNLTNKRYITNTVIQNFPASTVTNSPFPGGAVSEFGLVNNPRSLGAEVGIRF